MTIGERISIHRKEMNLSQEALGEKLGVSRQAVYKWESDLSLPDSNNLIELSKIFGISLNELLGEEPEVKPKEEKDTRVKKYIAIAVAALVVCVLVFQQITIAALAHNVRNLESTVGMLSQMINNRPNYPIYDENENYIYMEVKEVNFEENMMLVEVKVELKVEPNDAEVYVLFDKTRMDLIRNDSGSYVGTIELKILPRISAKLAVKSADKTTYTDYSRDDILFNYLLRIETDYFNTYLQANGNEISITSHLRIMNYDYGVNYEPFYVRFPDSNTVIDMALVTRGKETGKEVNRKEVKDEIFDNEAIIIKFDKSLLDVDDVYELTFEYLLNDKVIVQQLVGVIEYKDKEFIITPVQTIEYNFIIK